MSGRASSLPVLLLAFAAPVWGLAHPVAVSPGAADRPLLAVSGCPTFSWGAVPAHGSLRLTVHAVDDDGGLAPRPSFRVELPAGTTSWTPPADRCLSPGTYAWIVRAVGEMRNDWPEPFLFEVAIDDRPHASVSEANTSVDLAEHGDDASRIRRVSAPAVTPCGGIFNDVEATDPFCSFIQGAVLEALMNPCSPGLFCPADAVTRRQMASLLIAARHGSAGGVLTGNYPAPGLAAEFRLPQDCQAGDVVRWSGAQWICS